VDTEYDVEVELSPVEKGFQSKAHL